MLDQRRRQMLYKCFVFAGNLIGVNTAVMIIDRGDLKNDIF